MLRIRICIDIYRDKEVKICKKYIYEVKICKSMCKKNFEEDVKTIKKNYIKTNYLKKPSHELSRTVH